MCLLCLEMLAGRFISREDGWMIRTVETAFPDLSTTAIVWTRAAMIESEWVSGL